MTEFSKRVITLTGSETINGKMNFTSDAIMNGNMEVDGRINGINLTELAKNAFYKYGDQIVSGSVGFNRLVINGNVYLDGKVNSIDLSEETLTLTGNEEMNGKIFLNDLKIRGKLSVTGLVDNVNLTDLDIDAVRLQGLNIISAKKVFVDVLLVSGDMNVNGLVDNVDIVALNNSIMHRNQDQTINGSCQFQNDATFQTASTIDGYLNDLNISEFGRNVVTLNTDQAIDGEKHFGYLLVDDDLTVRTLYLTGAINGIDLSTLNDRIVKVKGMHIVDGIKRFQDNAKFEKDLKLLGKVNGLGFPQDIITSSRNQTINGVKVFQENIHINGDLVLLEGIKVDGVDVSLLAKNSVYDDKVQEISGSTEFKNIELNGGVTVKGLINGVNVTKSSLLLRNGEQSVSGSKQFMDILVKGNVDFNGKINNVDLQELNDTSVFIDRQNIITAEKEIVGNLIVKRMV